MGEAILEAKTSQDAGEVPVGALIWREGSIIARAHNETEISHDPTAHAECRAIQRAAKNRLNWRLSDCVIFVTLEPCTMCIGAIQLARLPLLVFGAYDPRMGAVGSLYDATAIMNNKSMRVVSGVRELECKEMLSEFFKARREPT